MPTIQSNAFNCEVVSQLARQVDWSADFEDGQLNPRGSGQLDASFALSHTTRVGAETFNIVSITKGNPTILQYSGGTPTELLPNSGLNSNGVGYQIVGLTGGMSDLNGHLVRLKNVGGGSAELWSDNWPAYLTGNAENGQALGTYSVDTTPGNYSNDSTGGTLQGFITGNDAGGGFGPNTAYENKVVQSGNNQVSADANVLARNGNFCFHSKIEYHAANFSNDKNKPRMTLNPSPDAQFQSDEPIWFGLSIYAPTDLCGDNSNQENMLLNFTMDSASNDFLHLIKVNDPPEWRIEWSRNQSGTTQNYIEVLDLGPIALGQWTDWVFFMDVNPFTGSLRVWRNVQGQAPVEITAGQLPLIGAGFGNLPVPGSDIHFTVRQYAFSWRHQPSICMVPTQEFLFDEIYIGRQANGTGFSDVHADRANQP